MRHREWFEPRNNAISKRNMIIVRASVVLNRTDEDYFAKSEHLHNYNTRSASNIHIGYERCNYGNFSVKFRGAKLWHNLPENLRNQKSYGRFKKTIKTNIQYHLK